MLRARCGCGIWRTNVTLQRLYAWTLLRLRLSPSDAVLSPLSNSRPSEKRYQTPLRPQLFLIVIQSRIVRRFGDEAGTRSITSMTSTNSHLLSVTLCVARQVTKRNGSFCTVFFYLYLAQSCSDVIVYATVSLFSLGLLNIRYSTSWRYAS